MVSTLDKIDYILLGGIFGSLIIGTLLAYVFSVYVPGTGVFVGTIDFVKGVIEAIGYLGIFLLALIEIVYPAIPGELVLPFVGFLVAENKLNFAIAILAATVGNVIGMFIIYLISMKLGRPFIERYGKYFLMDRRHLEMSEELFNKYGDVTVLFGRMLPAYRELVSVPAGLGKMRLAKFLIFTFIGSLIWDAALVFMGMKLGENYVLVKVWFDRLDLFIWISVILAVAWFIIKGRLREKSVVTHSS